jgi:hypothetical protein
MHSISIPQVDQTVEHIVIGLNEPCWFHGEPGCGKSQGIASAVERLGGQLIDFRLGQYDTVDFKGFPDIDRETNTTVWHMASTLPFIGNRRFEPDQPKVIFFDEADHGKDSVKGVAYQLVQERRVGEHVLQPNTFICLAGNRPQDRGIGGKSPPPLNNRCTHYEARPDAEAWVMWAGSQPHIPPELLAFLMFRKDLISTFDPKSTEPAFASARTWEKVGRYDMKPMPDDIRDASIEGSVGRGPSAEYLGFKKIIKDMVSIAEIERNPTTVKVSERPEVRWATAVGIGGELAKRPEASRPFQQFLDRMDPEFAILAWQLALKKNEQVVGTPEFITMARVHQAIFASVNRGD